MRAESGRFEGVKTEIRREEQRLCEIEDRLRRLEDERTAGEVRLIVRALTKMRESLGNGNGGPTLQVG